MSADPLIARQKEWRSQMWTAFIDEAPTAVLGGFIVAFGICALMLPMVGLADTLFLFLWILVSTPAFALGAAFAACGFYPTAARVAKASRLAKDLSK